MSKMASFSRAIECSWCPREADCGVDGGVPTCYFAKPAVNFKPSWISTLLEAFLSWQLIALMLFAVTVFFVLHKWPKSLPANVIRSAAMAPIVFFRWLVGKCRKTSVAPAPATGEVDATPKDEKEAEEAVYKELAELEARKKALLVKIAPV
ncbi:hypothetical protein CRE_23327 [Caenorhabditis remanei]|uniref:Uncharacterized protein n=1 Tax=Caenorhabditis remanei TaxID=31234 RepID=E3MGV9_CAERE|nr:hypothetical protein CRE_23327 [Caenorhabditis remanei]